MRRLVRNLVLGLSLVLALAVLPSASAHVTRPAAPRASSGLVVHFGAWGPLQLGMTNRQAWRTGMVLRHESYCSAGYLMAPRLSHRGFVLWTGQFPRMHVGGIVIISGTDRTRRGIGVGSTLRQVRRAYPHNLGLHTMSQLEGRPSTSDDMWVLSKHGRHGVLNFQFDFGRKPGPRKRVESMVIAPKPMAYPGC